MTDERLHRLEVWARIVSTLAIPVLVAVVGWCIQTAVQYQTVDRDYVQIAVNVLTQKTEDTDLKTWAVDVIDLKAPVAFTPALRKKLQEGPLLLPPVKLGFGDGGFGAAGFGEGTSGGTLDWQALKEFLRTHPETFPTLPKR